MKLPDPRKLANLAPIAASAAAGPAVGRLMDAVPALQRLRETNRTLYDALMAGGVAAIITWLMHAEREVTQAPPAQSHGMTPPGFLV